MSNTDWKDETVQELKKGYMAMITDRDERIAILTAGSEAMQEDARNNTATIKAQAEEIRTLKSVLREAEIEINTQTGGGNYSEILGNIRTALIGQQ